MEKIYKDTKWERIEGPDGEVDEAKVDGYAYGDRLLEGMPFYISLVDGHIKIRVDEKDQDWFKQFNKDYWFDMIYENIVARAKQGDEIPGGWDNRGDYFLIGKESNTIKPPEPVVVKAIRGDELIRKFKDFGKSDK